MGHEARLVQGGLAIGQHDVPIHQMAVDRLAGCNRAPTSLRRSSAP